MCPARLVGLFLLCSAHHPALGRRLLGGWEGSGAGIVTGSRRGQNGRWIRGGLSSLASVRAGANGEVGEFHEASAVRNQETPGLGSGGAGAGGKARGTDGVGQGGLGGEGRRESVSADGPTVARGMLLLQPRVQQQLRSLRALAVVTLKALANECLRAGG